MAGVAVAVQWRRQQQQQRDCLPDERRETEMTIRFL